MDQRRDRVPYVAVAAKLKEQLHGDTFKTTYGDSYHNTNDDSNFQAYKNFFLKHPTEDLSPYPMAQDHTEHIFRKPYQVEAELEQIRERRKRFEDGYEEQVRDNLHNQPPSRGSEFRQDERQAVMQSYDREQSPMKTPLYERSDPRHQQYFGESPVICCDRCYDKTKTKFLNRLMCNHLYCDDCLLSIPVQDRQFRSSLCYSCELCHGLTPYRKTVRLDPDGQVLDSYEDMKWFVNGGVKQGYST